MNYNIDTIVAISTPLGRGGIGVIRISGKSVPIITSKLLGKIPKPRKAEYLPFLDTNGTVLEQVIALFFPEPNSFTGENILEIHGHSGPIILDLLLERILKTSHDIRIAQPGEFTKRAFLNNKIDLIQAESISDIIDATSYQAAKSASNSLQGNFSNKIHTILEKIKNLRIHIESSIDFSEEHINHASYHDVKKLLKNIIYDTQQACKTAHYGIVLREGIKVVIAGKPNAGKSKLFNALIGIDRAIVSTLSGITRDTLHECIQLNGIAYNIVDTAGLQKNSNNEIEQIGMQRTWNELKSADHILWVIDSKTDKKSINIPQDTEKILCHNDSKKKPIITIIRNKSDLTKEKNGITTINNCTTLITLSALFNDGIELLKKHLSNNINQNAKLNYQTSDNQGNFIARRHHLNILEKSYQYLLSAQKQLLMMQNINELFAEEITLAHNELNKIFGKFTSEDLLDQIFSKFCIGK